MGNCEDNIAVSLEDPKRVAYALNMCTVSVSQIIDYNDINILDQEYDAILNNLNLEEMPKDDELLRVLKDLLDVITHFKVSEMEKQFIEREYQQKMKNAIWSAVPNFGMILAGGNPLTMAVSLANQVGIGYMNYRRNREEYGLEKDRNMWKLKRSAMDQFNFIRKELFDCAWRLADKHKFPDNYRLTEKQIKQYNLILQDTDNLRKYERLDSVKDQFEAYPPFWYFIGNAANLIANDTTLKLSDSSREAYRQKALTYFDKFEAIEQNSILREDVLSASCALEHIDLLLLDGCTDQQKIKGLLDKAVRMSGNGFDILQLCAISYLKIGKTDSAVKILRNLVNEDYNKTVNAQMLSAIYVHSFDRYKADYEILASRVNQRYLFPIPDGKHDVKALEASFECQRRKVVKQEVHATLTNFIRKYEVKWNAILSTFEADKDYPDDFFYENDTGKMKRKSEAERIFGISALKENYQKSLDNCNFEHNAQQILNDMVNNLFTLSIFSGEDIQANVENQIRDAIINSRETISKIQKAISGKSFQFSDYAYSQSFTLNGLIGEAVASMNQYADALINRSDASKVATIESDLLAFCATEEIESPENEIEKGAIVDESVKSQNRFNPELFGHQAIVEQRNIDFLNSMVRFVSDRIDRISIKDDKAEILLRDTPDFNGYFHDAAFKGTPDIEQHAIMILHDKSIWDADLIFTTDGIIDVHRGKVRYLTPYNEAELQNDKLILYGEKYSHKSVDMLALSDIINDLGAKFRKGIEDHIEYIPGVLTINILLNWFKQRNDAMNTNVSRVIAIPTKENLERYGYPVRDELDTSKNVMQCYYDSTTHDVLGMRIVRCEGIDSKLESLLYEHDGRVNVGR